MRAYLLSALIALMFTMTSVSALADTTWRNEGPIDDGNERICLLHHSQAVTFRIRKSIDRLEIGFFDLPQRLFDDADSPNFRVNMKVDDIYSYSNMGEVISVDTNKSTISVVTSTIDNSFIDALESGSRLYIIVANELLFGDSFSGYEMKYDLHGSSAALRKLYRCRTEMLEGAEGGGSSDRSQAPAARIVNPVSIMETPAGLLGSEEHSVTDGPRYWCSYSASDGDIVFDQLCDVSYGEPLSSCGYRPDLRSRFQFSFTSQSGVVLEPSCNETKPDQLNGIDVFPDTVIINGRRFYSYRLASGEVFQFELVQHSAEPNVAPWSDHWRRDAGGACNEKSSQGASTQTCAMIERLANPATTGGEFSGFVEYLLADGRRFEVSTVEEQVSIRYELGNGRSIEAENFGGGLIVEKELGSDGDSSDTCYQLSQGDREFCFEMSTHSSQAEKSHTAQPTSTTSPTSEFDPSSIDPSERTEIFAGGRKFEWEGKWANEDPRQCQCRPYQIDGFSNDEQFRCGRPPIILTRNKFTGYELDCEIREGRFGIRDDQFHLEGSCWSEGQEGIEIRITGFHSNSVVRLSFHGEGGDWMGDASHFPIKCPSDFDPSLVFDRD